MRPEAFFGPAQWYIDSAMGMGYDWVQGFPTHSLTGWERGIGLYEAAWNPTSLLRGALHLHGAADEPSRVTDYIVSPSPRKCQQIEQVMARRGLVQVVHDFDGVANHVVEIKPSPGLTPERYPIECDRFRQWLCLDTYHIMDDVSPYEISQRPELAERPSPLVGKNKDWRPAVIMLAPYVQIIHVHPEDVDAFVANPFKTRTGEMVRTCLRFGGRQKKYALVAEYHPGKRVLNPAKSRETAQDVLLAMRQLTAPFT